VKTASSAAAASCTATSSPTVSQGRLLVHCLAQR
jgi:hypothetical protein